LIVESMRLLALTLISPLAAQTEPAAPAPQSPARAAPVGGDLFPVEPPPTTSCLANAPALGVTEAPEGAVDGRTVKSSRALARLRAKRTGVIFVKDADLSGQRFSGRKLHDICFVDAKLGLSDWTGFTGTGIGFIRSDLTGAKFVDAKMPWSLFRDSKLTQVDATRVDLTRSRLDGGWSGSMRGLKLDGATLTGFRVECGLTAVDGCPLDREDLSLKGANLTKASFWPFYFPDVDATGAVLDQTEVGLEHLGRFRGSKLAGPLVVRGRRNAAIFLPAELARMQRAFLAGAVVDAASFDCKLAATPVQRTICTSPSSELRRLDRAVTQLEAMAKVAPNAGPRALAAAAQQTEAGRAAWIAQRDACGAKEEDEIETCLLTTYRARRDALARAAGAPNWVQPNGIALFISSDAPLTPEFIQSELFMRISPVVLDSAQARVLVRIDDAGRVEAKGAALGDCRVQATGLRYEPETLALVSGGQPGVAGRRGTRRRRAVAAVPAVPGTPVFSAAGDELRVVAEGAPFVRCGANGGFVPMTRVDLPARTLANLWAEP
jgi:uncharacterized protein YjbI with pentapeptide repeats